MKKKKSGRGAEQNSAKTDYKHYIFAFAAELVTLCALLSIFSIIIVKSNVSPCILPFLSIFSFAAAAFCAGFTAVRPKRKNGIVTGFISALPVLAISAAFIAALNNGTVTFVFIITIISQVFCSMAGGIAAANIRKKVR